MRIALVCPTVGRSRRGYERFITDLFGLLRRELDVTLFKGAGEPAADAIVVPHFDRNGILARLMRNRHPYARYRLEFATYAASLWPHLARGDFDVVHLINPPLVRPLATFRRLARHRYRLLFTDGGPMPFAASQYVDHIHCVSPAAHADALAAGMAPGRITMLPVGVDSLALRRVPDRDTLRRREGVTPGTFVVLAVTTLNRRHKRVDYLIDEIARLPGEVLLWIDASLHPDGDPALLAQAADRLGTRFRHTHVPSDRVGELYRLADVMVSTALAESFGMAIVEATCAGLPVLAHDAPHFRWLLGGAGHLVDMQAPGNLAARLAHLIGNPERLRGTVDPEGVERRFGWAGLKAGYVELYRRTIEATP